MPDISVIVPCYNQAHWLEEALASVEAQTFTDWECIIVDDGSVDDTDQVAAKWQEKDERFMLVQQANAGLAAARNSGIKKATGKFILPLDADDKIAASYMTAAMEAFSENPAAQLVYGHAAFFGNKTGEWHLPAYHWRGMLLENCIYCSAFFRRSDWEKAGGYNEDMRDGLEDWDFWLTLLDASSQVIKLDSLVFYYRQREDSMLHTLSQNEWANMESSINKVYRRHLEKYTAAFGHPFQLMRKNLQLLEEKQAWQNSWRYKLGKDLLAWIKK